MAQDAKANKSFGAANRTIAALKFHAERVREKSGDTPAASDHNEILGNMVDLHHRNMSQVRASMLRYNSFEARSGDSGLGMDEFEDDSGGEDELADVRDATLQTRSQNLSSSLLDSADYQLTSVPTKMGSSAPAKKAVHDIDPVSLFRQMRSGTMSRGGSQHIFNSLKGAYAFLPPPQAEPSNEELSEAKTDASLRRGKSFLIRPDQQQAGAAYDMLAQIRGPKWNADSSVKSTKSLTTGKTGELILLTSPRSEPRAELLLSSSVGSSMSGVAAAGGSKSFMSGPGKRPAGALPEVSVDASPHLLTSTDFERMPVPPSAAGPSSGGLLSRLKNIIKH